MSIKMTKWVSLESNEIQLNLLELTGLISQAQARLMLPPALMLHLGIRALGKAAVVVVVVVVVTVSEETVTSETASGKARQPSTWMN